MTKFSKAGDKGYQDILRELRRLAKGSAPENTVSASSAQELQIESQGTVMPNTPANA